MSNAKQKSVWGIALKAGTLQATQVFSNRQEVEDAIAKISHLSNGFEAVELGPVNPPALPDGWIKCSDELPPYETNVVMWDSRDKAPVIFNTYSEDSYTRGLKLYLAAMGMTHWKPVSPPTTEK